MSKNSNGEYGWMNIFVKIPVATKLILWLKVERYFNKTGTFFLKSLMLKSAI